MAQSNDIKYCLVGEDGAVAGRLDSRNMVGEDGAVAGGLDSTNNSFGTCRGADNPVSCNYLDLPCECDDVNCTKRRMIIDDESYDEEAIVPLTNEYIQRLLDGEFCECFLCTEYITPFNEEDLFYDKDEWRPLHFTTNRGTLYGGYPHAFPLKLVFDKMHYSKTIFMTDYCTRTFHLAQWLHVNIGINNFELIRKARVIDNVYELIFCGSEIHINGNFDKYTSEAWNRIMHTLNGNIDRTDECKSNHGGHLPVDKADVKAKTNRNGQKVFMNKNKNGFKKMWAPKEKQLEAKVDMEEISREMADSQGMADGRKVEEPPVIDVDCTFANLTGKSFAYYYKIEGDDIPVEGTNEELYLYNFIPIPRLRIASKKELARYYFLILFLSFSFYCLSDELPSITLYVLDVIRNNVDNAWIKLLCKVLYVFVETFCYCCWTIIKITEVCFGDYSRGLMLFFLVVMYKILDDRNFKWMRYIIYFPVVGKTYYMKRCQLRNPGDIFPIDKNMDLRRATDKNYKIEHASVPWYLDDFTVKYTDFGHYVNGKFKCDYTLSVTHKNEGSPVDLELVVQMLSPKNISMNCSPESIAERMMNSNNCGPMIDYNRENGIRNDMLNYSARFAHCVAMSYRYQALGVDFYDQVFRRSDKVRLLSVARMYSHF